MSTPYLRFDGVWKRFKRGQSHDSLRDLIPNLARKLTGRAAPESTLGSRDFWALSDISFSIEPGEVLGIIGPNGAGKSTTLKILNRIMEPTRGQVSVSGRVGALIEVSAGFHQDLTGRQNVFLQGAIMGMKRREVQQKFDAIVDFSGIEEFIDTPVKRYSNGMNARLGFSVAAHMFPEVLIIDEVLAVGDFSFQAKAYQRIKEMASSGAPVVLVSHQLNRVAEICTKGILLERGKIVHSGTAQACIDAHLRGQFSTDAAEVDPSAPFFLHAPVLEVGPAAKSGERIEVDISGTSRVEQDIHPTWTLGLRVIDQRTGTKVFTMFAADRGVTLPINQDFKQRLSLQLNLRAGTYLLQSFLWDSSYGGREVVSGPYAGVEVLETERSLGDIQLNGTWQMSRAS